MLPGNQQHQADINALEKIALMRKANRARRPEFLVLLTRIQLSCDRECPR